MKRVRLILRDPDLNKMIGNELNLSLEDSANIVDVIRKVDEIILEKGRFPITGCKSLLHLTYHPFEKKILQPCSPNRLFQIRKVPKCTW